jgi:enoyl-CoA hydratase/carnithine racemase
VTEVLRARVSSASFATIALEGHLFMPHEALELGLVDDVTASLDAKALSTAGVRGASPRAYAQIKGAQLAPVVAAWRARRPIDRETWLDTWFSDAAQRTLRAAVDRMMKR